MINSCKNTLYVDWNSEASSSNESELGLGISDQNVIRLSLSTSHQNFTRNWIKPRHQNVIALDSHNEASNNSVIGLVIGSIVILSLICVIATVTGSNDTTHTTSDLLIKPIENKTTVIIKKYRPKRTTMVINQHKHHPRTVIINKHRHKRSKKIVFLH